MKGFIDYSVLKLIGAFAVFLGCALFGIQKGSALSQRVKVLMGLENALLIFENEILYRLSPLSVAMEKAANSDKSGIFAAAAINVEHKYAVEACTEAVAKSALRNEEKSVMLSFAQGLGAEDKQGQTANASMCRERIHLLSCSAADKRDKLQRVYTRCGILCGIAAFIVLV